MLTPGSICIGIAKWYDRCSAVYNKSLKLIYRAARVFILAWQNFDIQWLGRNRQKTHKISAVYWPRLDEILKILEKHSKCRKEKRKCSSSIYKWRYLICFVAIWWMSCAWSFEQCFQHDNSLQQGLCLSKGSLKWSSSWSSIKSYQHE